MMTRDAHQRHQQHQQPIDERIAIDPNRPVEVLIQNVLGDIEVRTTREAQARVRCDRGRWHDVAGSVKFEFDENRIVIDTGFSRSFDLSGLTRGLFGRGRPVITVETGDWVEQDEIATWPEEPERGRRSGRGHRADILVELPEGVTTHARLRAASGEVKVSGI